MSGAARAWLGAATALAVLAAFVLGLCAMVFTGLMCFDGDAGEPYVKAGSTRAAVCAVEKPLYVPLSLLGAPAAALAGGVLAFSRRRWGPLGLGCAAAVAVLLVPAGAVYATSPRCDGALMPNAPGCG